MAAVNLGKLSDSIYQKTSEIAAAEAVVKALTDERRELEEKLLGAMHAAGTDIARGKLATASISKTVRAQIQDFEKLETFVYRKKALHLFEKRISSKAFAEMKELLGGKPVPGLTEYENERLNIRKV